MRLFQKIYAFTLAEVLITIGIVGVIAAITIPSLITKYEKQKVATKLKLSYAELGNVIKMAEADYGDSSGWGYTTPDELPQWVDTYIAPYVKNSGVYDCRNVNSPCQGINGLGVLGYRIHYNNANATRLGYMIKTGINSAAWSFIRDTSAKSVETKVVVHINNRNVINAGKYAKQSRNILGRDAFAFVFDTRDLHPTIRPYEEYASTYAPKLNVSKRDYLLNYVVRNGQCKVGGKQNDNWHTGATCTAVIMYDGWKINDDYPWQNSFY